MLAWKRVGGQGYKEVVSKCNAWIVRERVRERKSNGKRWADVAKNDSEPTTGTGEKRLPELIGKIVRWIFAGLVIPPTRIP